MNLDFPSCSTIATAFNKDQNIINEASQASSNNLTPHDVQAIVIMNMCKNTYTRTNHPYESITSQYRKYFAQGKNLGFNNDISTLKKQCRDKAVEKMKTNHYDKDAFKRDTSIRVHLLTESKAFQKWSQDKNLDTFAAATNVVMLGITILRNILCDNIINRKGIQLDYFPDWNTPLFTREELNMEAVPKDPQAA